MTRIISPIPIRAIPKVDRWIKVLLTQYPNALDLPLVSKSQESFIFVVEAPILSLDSPCSVSPSPNSLLICENPIVEPDQCPLDFLYKIPIDMICNVFKTMIGSEI